MSATRHIKGIEKDEERERHSGVVETYPQPQEILW
jgi:hypothetical protein